MGMCFEILLYILVLALSTVTGHGVLWAITRGRWKPSEKGSDGHEMASLVGLVVLLGIGAAVAFAFVVR